MSLAPRNDDIAWRPTADMQTLRLRAAILAKIRQFFAVRDVLEVETPVLCRSTATDPFLQSLAVDYAGQHWYLQTSPEYAMKRLLAAGSGPIYQICKAFRGDESGRLHNPEFTLLEWYRIDFDHHALMDEMDELLQTILSVAPAARLSYAELFQRYLSINPHTVSTAALHDVAERHHLQIVGKDLNRDDWLQLLLAHLIEPHLGQSAPTFVYDFPASQAALAKIRVDRWSVAERFEVYLQGIELANGYHELADASEQAERFQADLAKRAAQNCPDVAVDNYLLAALAHGLPNCAGVALGIDRLVMIAAKKTRLPEVMAFASERV